MPLILACDTTQAACSAALHADAPIAAASEAMTAGHAEALMPMIERLLSDAALAPAALDRLAVTCGPGTFTGTRVGLAAMRGLALALDIPLKAYGTLAVMAAAMPTETPHIVAVDARRSTFYAQAFAAGGAGMKAALTPPQALTLAQLAALLPDPRVSVSGSGAAALAACDAARFRLVDGPAHPQASVLAAIAAADADWADLPPAEPFYLRPPDAALPDPDKIPARK